MWWVLGVAATLCVGALIVIGFTMVPNLLGSGEEPTPTPVPQVTSTLQPTVAASPMPTQSSVEATATQVANPASGVSVAIAAVTETVQSGDAFSVTVTITNTGQVPASNLRFRLVGEWEPHLDLNESAPIRHDEGIPAGESHSVQFDLEALNEGTALVQAYVIVEAGETEGYLSEEMLRIDVRP